jgi:hypothetical protein
MADNLKSEVGQTRQNCYNPPAAEASEGGNTPNLVETPFV